MKLAIIIPYKYEDDYREKFEKIFYHMDYFLKDKKNLDWKIFFIQQMDKTLNWGKCYNIGYKFATETEDFHSFVVFQDFRLLPHFDNNIFEPVDKPIHLGHSFFSTEKVKRTGWVEDESLEVLKEDFNNDVPLYETFCGGSFIIPTSLFEVVNGFSNKYNGYGFHDDDFFERLKIFNMPMDISYTKDTFLNYMNLNGQTSYGEFTETEITKHLFDNEFTINVKFYVEDKPPATVFEDNNRCEYQIICKPGYHTGISVTSDYKLKVNVFDVDNLSYTCDIRIQPKTWYNLSWTYNAKAQIDKFQKDWMKFYPEHSLYLNGKFMKTFRTHKPIKGYENEPLYVGVGNPKGKQWRSYMKGKISEISIYDKYLNQNEIERLDDYGVSSYEKLSGIKPITHIPFNSGYKNFVFDVSGSVNHLKTINTKVYSGILKKANVKKQPYRKRGIFKYTGNVMEDYSHKKTYTGNKNNYNTFTELTMGGEDVAQSDGINNLRFRLDKRFRLTESDHRAEVFNVKV